MDDQAVICIVHNPTDIWDLYIQNLDFRILAWDTCYQLDI